MRKITKIFLTGLIVCVSALMLVQLSFAADVSSKAARVKTSGGNLNIRKSASVSSEILKTAKNKSPANTRANAPQ